MANNPNDADPKRNSPNDPKAKRPADRKPDDAPFEDLPPLSEYDISLNDDELLEEVMPDTVPTTNPPQPILPPDPESEVVSFDAPVPTGDPASFTIGVSLEDLANLPDDPDLSGILPMAQPASGELNVPEGTPESSARIGPGHGSWDDSDTEIGNLEPISPISPVAPASGWLDSDHGDTNQPLELNQADLFEQPPQPTIESSDIFGSGPLPKATGVEHSDVISATAYGAATPTDPGKQPPGRLSDIALSFEQPPGGSTLHEGGSGDLPIADEVFDADESPDSSLFSDVPAALPFDSAKLPGGDAPDFGATPRHTPDASSILADLSEPGAPTIGDSSSAVRLEAPGMERTFSSDHGDGTEFDLTVDDGMIPPELSEAEAASGQPIDWRQQSGSDLFADSRAPTEADVELDSGRVNPVDPDLVSDDPSLSSAPSSIFSDKGGPMSKGGSGRVDGSAEVPIAEGLNKGPGGSDSSVEFSDQPQAEDEASASRIFGSPTPPRLNPPKSPSLRQSTPSMGEFEIPDEPAAVPTNADDGGMIDWTIPDTDDDATIGVSRDVLDSPPSGILSRGKPAKPPEEKPTPASKGKPTPVSKGKPTKPLPPEDSSVEIDWVAGSSIEEPPLAEKPEPKKPRKQPKEELQNRAMAAPGRRGGGGWVGGTLLGIVIAGGAVAGAYFGDFISFGEKTAQTPPPGGGGKQQPITPPNAGQPTAADIAAAIRAGDAAKAKQIAAALNDTTPAGKAAAGEAQFFALVQSGDKIGADNADLKAARENLQSLVDDADAAKTPEGEKAAVKAAIQLGLTHQLAGDPKAAREVYLSAIKKFPKYAATFEAALDRLDATAPPAAPPPPDGTSRRIDIDPAHAQQLLVALILLQADDPLVEEPEAGVFFWKAVKLANGEKFTEAIEMIGKAKAAHIKQAKAKAGQGLNPLSDPLEQIFPRSCDDLKAYWELRVAIYGNKAFAELIKKDGAEKAVAELQRRADSAVKLMTDLKDTSDKLAKANTDLTKAETDLKTAKAEYKKLEDRAELAAVNAKKQQLELIEAIEKATALDRERQKADTLVASLAKELQTAKLLGEKYDAAELLAAQKRATDRATGPNLTTLLPNSMVVVGGGGLSAAQLIDTAERLAKAETAAKVATAKLTTETKRLTTEHDAAVDKLKTDHVAAMKKLTDGYAADIKKLMDTNATTVTKIKDDHVAELKKMNDKFIADSKKLTDSFEAKIRTLEVAVVAEKDRAAAREEQFKKDLGNAISPAQALDLWLPVLVELRRPSDSDAALATASKVIASAPPDSEDAGKARTVAGLALLYKNEMPMAKAMFQAARSNPSHKPALEAKKLWAIAANVGLDSVDDPLAAYRLPPELPHRDPIAAARFLDTGVKAYRDGRYTVAVTALTDSTKADPTNPIAWYFLGAARWEMGSTDAGKDAFEQGAQREKATNMPSRFINSALSPIQGPTRDALSAARP